MTKSSYTDPETEKKLQAQWEATADSPEGRTKGAMGGNIRAGGRPGRSDPRGSSYSRRARKTKMLSDPNFHRRPGTEGKNVNCTHCGRELNFHTVEADRKIPGGPYAYHNVQPSCRECNLRRSDKEAWVHPSKLSNE